MLMYGVWTSILDQASCTTLFVCIDILDTHVAHLWPKPKGENMRNPAVNVLLIEDDDTEAVQRAFDKAKIANAITVAADGVEALKILRGEDGYGRLSRPYIILLDIQMPRMNGIDFLHTIRRDPELKSSVVFVLTTSDNQEDMEAAYSEQVAGYFLKKKVGQAFFALPDLMKNYWRMVEWPIFT
jgi:CheY-like chemotaxis protein